MIPLIAGLVAAAVVWTAVFTIKRLLDRTLVLEAALKELRQLKDAEARITVVVEYPEDVHQWLKADLAEALV